MVGKISKNRTATGEYRNQKQSPQVSRREWRCPSLDEPCSFIQWMPRRHPEHLWSNCLPGHRYEGLIHKSGLWILTLLLMSDTRLYTYQIFCQKGWCQPMCLTELQELQILFSYVIMPKGKGRKDIGIMFFKHRHVIQNWHTKQTEKIMCS